MRNWNLVSHLRRRKTEALRYTRVFSETERRLMTRGYRRHTFIFLRLRKNAAASSILVLTYTCRCIFRERTKSSKLRQGELGSPRTTFGIWRNKKIQVDLARKPNSPVIFINGNIYRNSRHNYRSLALLPLLRRDGLGPHRRQ